MSSDFKNWSKEDWDASLEVIESLRDRMAEADRIALNAVLEDQEKLFSPPEKQPLNAAILNSILLPLFSIYRFLRVLFSRNYTQYPHLRLIQIAIIIFAFPLLCYGAFILRSHITSSSITHLFDCNSIGIETTDDDSGALNSEDSR